MPSGRMKKIYSVDKHFSEVDDAGRVKCLVCDVWTAKTSSVRKKMEHLLHIGTGVASCRDSQEKLDEKELETMTSELNEMDNVRDFQTAKRSEEASAADIPLPKRPRSAFKQSTLEIVKNDAKDMEFTRMIVMTCSRSGFVDSLFTKNFFSKCFGYSIPSRRKVFRDLIPVLFQSTQKQVKEICAFDRKSSYCTLATDGWSGPDGQKLRNYTIVLEDVCFLHSTVSTGTSTQDSPAIAAGISTAIDEIGASNVVSLVTDNASAETTAWDIVREKHEDVLCTGCVTHGGNLLFKDVVQEYNWSKNIVEEACDLGRFIRSHTWLNMSVRGICGTTPTYHCATRFAGSYFTMHSLLLIKDTIRTVFATTEYQNKNYENGDVMFALVMRNDFWADLTSLLDFLKPLKDFIRTMDADRHMTEHLIPLMTDMRSEWASNVAVPPRFRTHALRKLDDRWDWMEFDTHRAAYALSPYYHADDVSGNNKVMRGVDEIVKFYCLKGTTSVSSVMSDFARYKSRLADPSVLPSRGESATQPDALSSLSWWRWYGSYWPNLQQIALRVFAIGTSSSTSERNWSTLGHIWNKRSTNYTYDTAQKMSYINFNLTAINNYRLKQALRSKIDELKNGAAVPQLLPLNAHVDITSDNEPGDI